MPKKTITLSPLLALALTACAGHAIPLSSGPALHGPVTAADTRPDPSSWAFTTSDLLLDPAWHFGRLSNGMRYIVRHNATPAGTAMVRLDVDVGSLDERADELGYAHFIEHMAFNGSTHVPEGQMVPLLEKDGLAFGADTNASTNFDRTDYKLDLPRADPALLDTALMLMRETAGNLTLAPDAIARERGVVLSEMRDRNTWAYRNTQQSMQFYYPGSRFAERFPIGTKATLDAATSASLRAFYEREYVPSRMVLIVVGDFDTDSVVKAIKQRFDDFKAAPDGTTARQPGAGPINAVDKGRTDIYLDPALSERITIVRNGPWLNEPDTARQRERNVLRSIGYQIINRRLQSLSRTGSPPFRGAGFGTGDVFEAGRSTRLVVDTVDGHWKEGLTAAAHEYRRALTDGFTTAEVAEQVANLRSSIANAAAAAETRSNRELIASAESLVNDRLVPTTPQSVLDRFEAFAPRITPAAVLDAVRHEAVPLIDPLIRFNGRLAPDGGAKALRDAWRAALKSPLAASAARDNVAFAYTDFGTPGTVVSDKVDPQLGIREVRFANGVMLNLKHTDLAKDQILTSFALDGGDKLDTKASPVATEMTSALDEGGLGKHSLDQIQTITAGRTVSLGLRSDDSSFDAQFRTTPADLRLQLELMAALITDPGYRPEGEVQYRQQVNTYFAQLGSTPASALQAEAGGILSDHDPRFTLQPADTYRHLTFAKLKDTISDRLAHGAIEIGLVGDVDEDKAIALVAATFGALPPREPAFRNYADQPPRTFTQDRGEYIVRHSGTADQALMQFTWPTRDNSDPQAAIALGLLESVTRITITDELREALGKTYSPSAVSRLSRDWKGYGTFQIQASVDVSDVPATGKAIERVVMKLRDATVSADVLQRARAPMMERLLNMLKSNGGWLSLVDRAQTQPEQIDRFEQAKQRLNALTAADVQAEARRYLDPAKAVKILVLPKDVPVPEE